MIIIALGSNLPFGGRTSAEIVEAAMIACAEFGPVSGRSGLWRSPAWPDPADPPYVNAAMGLADGPAPEALLAGLQGIEAAFGRRRGQANAPRSLDLDIVCWKGRVCDNPSAPPILPHPRAAERDFVLAPICAFAPDWRHPVLGKSAQSLLAALPERSARLI